MPQSPFWSRRTFIIGSASALTLAGCKSAPEISVEEANAQLSALEGLTGGRIGVSALNKKRDLQLHHRGDERFAMCSSFKWILAYFVVTENYYEGLRREIQYSRSDLISWSPITEPALKGGNTASLTLRALCEAAVEYSDNTATNLLLREIGGPEGLTARIRQTGDQITRLDRIEPALNANTPGDPRDTTTPNAMTALVSNLLFGTGSGMNGVTAVREMMMGNTTGDNRLRAGIPKGHWVIGDKTGTSSNNQSNDVAFAFTFPTNYTSMDGPIIMTSFLNVENPSSPETDRVHQQIASICLQALA